MIRFGMALMEMIEQLTKGFIKVTGRQPDNLEKLKIQQEAVQRFKEMNKVVNMQGRTLDPTKPIIGGTQEGIMKATGAKPKKIQRESLEDFVDDAGGVDPNDPRGIDDFIPDPEDMAQGGRAGFFMGSKFPKGLEGLTRLIKKEKARTQRRSGNLRANNMQRTKIGEPKEGVDYDYYKEILGEDPEVDYYPVKGDETEEFLEAMVKEQEAEMAYMKRLYDKGALNPTAGETTMGRLKMLEDKAQMGESLSNEEIAEIKRLSEIFNKAQGGRIGFDDGGYSMGPELGFKINNALNQKSLDLFGVLFNFLDDKQKKIVTKRVGNADGGIARLGFKDGMTRRTFMKILGGAMAIPIVGKFLKLTKVGQTVKKVPIIKTENVAGKPEWFDQLVNKVIVEGDDVTKKFATGERQFIHQKKLDDGSLVRVTEDVDDGAVRVEYQSDANVFGETVQLQYKKPLPDEGAPSPKAEFTTAESGPVGRQSGPDDYDIDIDEVGGTSISDLDSDVSKLKEYATGKKPTMKELVQNIERRKKAARITDDPEAQMDSIISRQGEMLDYDDYASGGIARMLGE